MKRYEQRKRGKKNPRIIKVEQKMNETEAK